MQAAVSRRRLADLVLPGLLLAGLSALIGTQLGWYELPRLALPDAAPQTTIVAPRTFAYRAPGEFRRGTAVIDGPMVEANRTEPLEIMTYEVTTADYARCVADAACTRAAPRWKATGSTPVTGVSYDDATAYARWLSRTTGAAWRLPTIEEWTFAAGSRAQDPALGIDDDGDPSERWLLAYEQEAALAADGPSRPEASGSAGLNEYGIADLDGPVWEWTSTCASRSALDAAGAVLTRTQSCGVRYLEGRHRTQMSSFIRDAIGGGCSTGAPPDNLGFRLVRDPAWWEGIARWLRAAGCVHRRKDRIEIAHPLG